MALRLFAALMIVCGFLAAAYVLSLSGTGWLFAVVGVFALLISTVLFALANIVDALERIAQASETSATLLAHRMRKTQP